MNGPRLFICRRCVGLRRQMRRYRYKDHPSRLETVRNPADDAQPVDNDLIDATRYLLAQDVHYVDEEAEEALAEYRGNRVTGY